MDAGANVDTLRKAMARNSKQVQHCRDPEDNKRVLLLYDKLAPNYKRQYDEKWGNPYQLANTDKVTTIIESKLKAKNKLEKRVEQSYDPQVYQAFLQQMPQAEATDRTRGAAWLAILSSIKGKAMLRELGFETKVQLYESAIAHLKANPIRGLNVSNVRVLERRIEQYNTEGFKSMIQQYSSKTGENANRATLLKNEEAQKYLIATYSKENKPTFRRTTDVFNAAALKYGWEQITESTAYKYLKQPSIERVWYLARHGEKAWYNRYDTTILREQVSAPNAMWMIDGTPIDLYFQSTKQVWDEKAQKHKTVSTHYNRIYCFFIIDAHSWKIVGYALSKTETANLVRDALKNAVRNTGCLPHQLQSDKGAAITAQEHLKGMLEKVYHVPTRPYSPKGKQIEGIIGHFQGMVLRYFPNWAGMNITAKSQNSRFNPEYIEAQKKDLPNVEGVTAQIKEAIEEWNSMATKGRNAPNDKYIATESVGTSIETIGYISLFLDAASHQYKYQTWGISLQIEGKHYTYEVLDTNFYKKHILDYFQVIIDKDCLDYIFLFQHGKIVTDADGEPLIATAVVKTPQALYDYKEGSRTLINSKIAFKDTVRNETRTEAEAAKEYAKTHNISLRISNKEAANTLEGQQKIAAAGLKQEDEDEDIDWDNAIENRFYKRKTT
ncbi:MAG: hypothetical protein RLZZ292_881 [Bacteroidota bacterium]